MNPITKRDIVILGFVSAFSLCVYILYSHFYYKIGFPLDDAWIHQTYARNLGESGEWAFIKGELSGGSTSPLWSWLLSIGYLLDINPYSWAFFLGFIILWGLSIAGTALFKALFPNYEGSNLLPGLLLSLEWHCVWAAASGMETLLFSLLVVLIFCFILDEKKTNSWWIWSGGLIGLSVWIRPEGVTLLGPALWVSYFVNQDRKKKISAGMSLAFGFLIFFGLYLWFMQATADSVWPSTFFAKQAEYSEITNESYIQRLFAQFQLPIVGVGIALLPGFISFLVGLISKKQWSFISIYLWTFGFMAIYAWRLPVTYQHGRYMIPVMPLFFLLGLAGMFGWITRGNETSFLRIVKRTWIAAATIVLIAFWLIGAKSYANDVAFIESEMVTVALWLRDNTTENATIAVHDIGAIGYFSDREILDLAGLISPEVIPFIRNETKLARFLDQRSVAYLVTFPGWYPELVGSLRLIYQTNSLISPSMGGENLSIYEWSGP